MMLRKPFGQHINDISLGILPDAKAQMEGYKNHNEWIIVFIILLETIH